MSDERFYDQVRSTMSGYAPEVPQAAYGKMRRALWWSNFTKLSVSRFNMWYLIALLGLGGGAAAMMSSSNQPLQPAAMAPVIQTEPTALPVMSASSNTVSELPSCSASPTCQTTSHARSRSSMQESSSVVETTASVANTGEGNPGTGEVTINCVTPPEPIDNTAENTEQVGTEKPAEEVKKVDNRKPYGIKTLVDEKTKKKSPKDK